MDSKPVGEQNNDYESTIFIGNLPWVLNEEDLRKHFEDCGEILNVRIVRDKDTFIGKGIAYIQFKNKDMMKEAMLKKNDSLFKGRKLRVKRATPSDRRDKKQDNKVKKRDEKRIEKQDTKKKKVRRHHKKEEVEEGPKVEKVEPSLDKTQ